MAKQRATRSIRKAKKNRFLQTQNESGQFQPAKENSHPIAQLQRTLGNREIARLIQAKRLSSAGEILPLQRKLTVGAADDQYEQEADRVAHQVMNTPDTAVAANSVQRDTLPEEDKDKMLQTKPLVASITPFVQREAVKNEELEDKDKPVQAKFLNGISRQPLQRQPETDEEDKDKGKLLQTKPLAASITPFVQREAVKNEELEDKEPVQAKFLNGSSRQPLQRQPEVEEEKKEPIQAKSVASTSRSFEAGDAVETQVSQSKGHGSPLPDSVRSYMEPRFGVDFSHVRVHTGSDSIQMNKDVGAQAFTHGSDIYFGEGRNPSNLELTAHELTHVVQQTGGEPLQTKRGDEASLANTGQYLQRFAIQQKCSECEREEQEGNIQRKKEFDEESQISDTLPSSSDAIQRAGDPAAIPPGFPCPTDLSPGRPAGTDLLFSVGGSTVTSAHTALLTTFRDSWLRAGGTDDILVHGYSSTDGDQGPNWTLSCDRALAVQAELIRLGIPAVRISVVAHGESTDFGGGAAANRHAVVSSSSSGILPLPLITGTLTASDNFAGRSATRFGVGETINLNFLSLPPRPAGDFGGLQWFLVSGGGTLAPGVVANDGTATYTAPATADTVQLELRVATGATAGSVISTHTITIVIPSGVRMTAVAGTAPSFSFTGPIPAGTWGAGFQANVFVDPRDVSFQGVVFGEGTVASTVTPAGGFQGSFVHPVNTFGPGHAGNATTGTPVSPPVDNIISERKAPAGTIPGLGTPICGASDFLWAIPWEFSVAGGPRTPFAGGFTANHHVISTFFCDATIEKAGAGPFCRRIDGTTC